MISKNLKIKHKLPYNLSDQIILLVAMMQVQDSKTLQSQEIIRYIKNKNHLASHQTKLVDYFHTNNNIPNMMRFNKMLLLVSDLILGFQIKYEIMTIILETKYLHKDQVQDLFPIIYRRLNPHLKLDFFLVAKIIILRRLWYLHQETQEI